MEVHGKTKQDRLIEYFELISSICSRLPAISNKFSQKAVVKRFLGIHPKRQIPPIASQSFLNWFNQHRPAPDNPSDKLILLVETFMNYFEPNIGIAATEYLTQSGITVIPSPCLPSIRAAISQGLLRTAKARIHQWVKQLTPLP